ncbi:MAG: GNAT family N-acetyltransferase, partial [candidate division Zixibacteria bacterium]
TAIISLKSSQEFYTALARRLSKLGWLEWHILYTDDRPIAIHLSIKMGRVLVINKIGFDEEFAWCSPGNILFERAVQRAFDSKDTDEINCLTDMAWHDNWKMIKKDYYDFWIYPRCPIPLIYGVLPKKIRRWGRRLPAVKSLYKRIRSMAKGA